MVMRIYELDAMQEKHDPPCICPEPEIGEEGICKGCGGRW